MKRQHTGGKLAWVGNYECKQICQDKHDIAGKSAAQNFRGQIWLNSYLVSAMNHDSFDSL